MPDRTRSVQQAFLTGVLSGNESPPAALQALLRTPPLGSLESRWHIYADGFVARIVEAIENDYPALAKVLGSGPLRSLTARYVRRFPPRSHDLGRVGDRLAVFLESDGLIEGLPFLPDLARLEWAVAAVFVAPDTTTLCWADLMGIGPEAAADAPLALRPGAALVGSTWPIHEIWSCRGKPSADIDVPLSREVQTVLVSRRGLEVVCRPASDIETQLFRVAEYGGRVADIPCRGAQEADELVTAFRLLVEDGVFAQAPGRVALRPIDDSRDPSGRMTCLHRIRDVY